MFAFTRILTAVFDVLLTPFGSHRLLALVVLSLVSGTLLTLLFRAVSRQDAIRRARAHFQARILELRLYPDDAVLIARAFGGAMAAQGAYLRAALLPILVVAVVAVPLFVQVEQRFARAPLAKGSRTLVTVRFEPIDAARNAVPVLKGAELLRVDTRPVRVKATGEVVWPVEVLGDGRHHLEVGTEQRTHAFTVEATASTRVIGSHRDASSAVDGLVNAGLPALTGDTGLRALRVEYPTASYRVLGNQTGWLGIFLIGTLLGAILPARLLKIQL